MNFDQERLRVGRRPVEVWPPEAEIYCRICHRMVAAQTIGKEFLVPEPHYRAGFADDSTRRNVVRCHGDYNHQSAKIGHGMEDREAAFYVSEKEYSERSIVLTKKYMKFWMVGND